MNRRAGCASGRALAVHSGSGVMAVLETCEWRGRHPERVPRGKARIGIWKQILVACACSANGAKLLLGFPVIGEIA